jgi:hypothetical protein
MMLGDVAQTGVRSGATLPRIAEIAGKMDVDFATEVGSLTRHVSEMIRVPRKEINEQTRRLREFHGVNNCIQSDIAAYCECGGRCIP